MTIEYIIEHKLKDEPFYRKSFNGFKNKDLALKIAESNVGMSKDTMIQRVRIIRQERKTIKVFKIKGGQINDKAI